MAFRLPFMLQIILQLLEETFLSIPKSIDESDNLLMFLRSDYIRGYDFLDIDSLSAKISFLYQ